MELCEDIWKEIKEYLSLFQTRRLSLVNKNFSDLFSPEIQKKNDEKFIYLSLNYHLAFFNKRKLLILNRILKRCEGYNWDFGPNDLWHDDFSHSKKLYNFDRTDVIMIPGSDKIYECAVCQNGRRIRLDYLSKHRRTRHHKYNFETIDWNYWVNYYFHKNIPPYGKGFNIEDAEYYTSSSSDSN
jgi:hypothetical protein